MWSTSAFSWEIPYSGTCCGSCQLVSLCSSLCLPSSSQHLFLPLAHHFCHTFASIVLPPYVTLDKKMFKLLGVGTTDRAAEMKPISYSQSIHGFVSSRGKSVVFIKPRSKHARADRKISMNKLIFVMDDTSIPCTRLLWGFFSVWGLIAWLMGMCLCIREKCFFKTCWNELKWRTSLKLSSLLPLSFGRDLISSVTGEKVRVCDTVWECETSGLLLLLYCFRLF